MKSKNLSDHKWGIPITVVIFLSLTGYFLFNNSSLRYGFEITDDLGGNIFPSAILSVASTDTQIIIPSDTNYLGNPKSIIGVRIRSSKHLSHVRVELAETKFFAQSVSEFDLPKPNIDYTIYPDIIWKYEALKNNAQPEPLSVVVEAEINGKKIGRDVRTFSVRSINECLLGYCIFQLNYIPLFHLRKHIT